MRLAKKYEYDYYIIIISKYCYCSTLFSGSNDSLLRFIGKRRQSNLCLQRSFLYYRLYRIMRDITGADEVVPEMN